MLALSMSDRKVSKGVWDKHHSNFIGDVANEVDRKPLQFLRCIAHTVILHHRQSNHPRLIDGRGLCLGQDGRSTKHEGIVVVLHSG